MKYSLAQENKNTEIKNIKKVWYTPDIASLNSKDTFGGLSSGTVEDDQYINLDPS
jgi:hypothetical protein